jgi:hypothetical protein
MEPGTLITTIPAGFRMVLIVLLAVVAHFIVQELKRLSRWMLSLKLGTETSTRKIFTRRYPKVASVTTILVSGLTFAVYFMAIG